MYYYMCILLCLSWYRSLKTFIAKHNIHREDDTQLSEFSQSKHPWNHPLGQETDAASSPVPPLSLSRPDPVKVNQSSD